MRKSLETGVSNPHRIINRSFAENDKSPERIGNGVRCFHYFLPNFKVGVVLGWKLIGV